MAVLHEAVAGAAQGRSSVVVIEGPAGIGKTRLLAEARRLAHDAGAHVLIARASELESELAFGVVRQLFERAISAEGGEPLARAADTAAQALDRPPQAAGATTPRDSSFGILHALYEVTVALAADSPLAIAVDDLHWCDEPSLRFLNYLLRRLDGLAVTVLCTIRPREPAARVVLVTEIVGDPLAIPVLPAPLSLEATAQLIGDGLGVPAAVAFAAACHAATDGNPLLLKELISTLRVEGVVPDAGHVAAVTDLGPRAVSRAVLVRLARLDDHALRLARAASVVRAGADLPFLAELAGLDPGDAAPAADTLDAAAVLRQDEDEANVHPSVGAAVYEDVPKHERSLAHERAARLLHEGGHPAGTVAAHLVLAPARGQAWVCDVLEAAARESLRAGSPASAAGYLARALAEPPPRQRRAPMLLELGGAEGMFDAASGIEHLTQAFDQGGGTAVRGMAAVVLARALLLNARPEESVALIDRASLELDSGSDLRLALKALALFEPTFGTGRPLSPAELARCLAPGTGVGTKMVTAVVSRQLAYAGGSAEACARLALEALDGGALIAADAGLLSITAILTLVRADRPEAEDAWEEVLRQTRASGSLAAKAANSLWRGYAYLRRGELDRAEEWLQNAREEFWLLSQELPTVHHAAFFSGILRERGELDRARHVLDAVTTSRGASDGARYWLDARAELLLAEGRFAEALAVAEEMERRFVFLANPIDTPARAHRAVALFSLGRRDEGLALAADSLALARRWGAPGGMARALRILGTLEGADGLTHLRAAVEAGEWSPARLEHAKSLVALGTVMLRARRRADAREPLRRGLELAAALGAGALVAEARHDLRAAGARPRTTALTGPAALTPAERRVTERAAAGETNRAIAAALFVTNKTVELHLRTAYRKLGVSSRRELAGKLDVA